jgi:subtilase family serine protease
MGFINRPARAGAIAVMGLAITATTGAFAATGAMAAPAHAGPSLVAVKQSLAPTTDKVTGHFTSKRMSIEVSLAPRNATGLNRTLKAIYTKHSGSYHKWLATGKFDARYAPTVTTSNAVKSYLRGEGLRIAKSSSPFLIRAVGSSARMQAAFHTTLNTYRDSRKISYFSNSSAIMLPGAIASHVLGVIGLANTARESTSILRAPHTLHPHAGAVHAATVPTPPSCETPYPTEQQLANAILGISGFPFGYGNSPGCQGLSPDQLNGIYGAPNVGPRGKGKGVNLGVFELSAYQQSDVQTYARNFFGPSYTAPLVDVNVDGGSLAPQCPVGDQCPANFNGFAGDIEVDADIEVQLAMAPDVSHLTVYDAPNDFTGQTELDEWTQIAKDNTVAAVSSSWAECENDAGAAIAQAENTVFEQMAAQGQSTFGAEGDTGAFSCIRSDGTTILNVLDPPSQPWVTSVGGTSFNNFNPGGNDNPSYPTGQETVWNFMNLCNSGPGSDGLTGFDWCAGDGAGGGGNSEFWGRPFYQFGSGVNNSLTVTANGSTNCQLASTGTPCREDPDVSANADENTPYGEFCTGNANTPFSVCGTFSQFENPPGWFGIGGTSLSSPLWSGIAADRDSFQGFRSGNLNPLLYILYNLAPSVYFHDITGAGTQETNNGFFPTVKGYDEATGIGTPRMAAIIALSL